MTGKDSFKGMPSWKGKGKGDGKNKGGKPYQQQQPPQANVAQQASSSASQAPEKAEVAQAEESLPRPKKAGVTTMTPIGQMTGQHMIPTMDMMVITHKVIGTIDLTMLPLRN
jgi:hypothetical protein